MAVTSGIDRLLDLGECMIHNWKEAGLLKPSTIKPVLSTIEQKLVLKKLGALSAGDLASLVAVLKNLLELLAHSGQATFSYDSIFYFVSTGSIVVTKLGQYPN